MMKHQRGLQGLQGVPQDDRRDRRRMMPVSMEEEMLPEEILAMMQGAGGAPDPRIMELSRMMGQPGLQPRTGPSMSGKTTENYLDPMMVDTLRGDEDQHEEDQMIEDYQVQERSMDPFGFDQGRRDPAPNDPSNISTEDELDMVNEEINKTSAEGNKPVSKDHEMWQDIDSDRQYLLSLIDDGEDVGDLVDQFEEYYNEPLDRNTSED